MSSAAIQPLSSDLAREMLKHLDLKDANTKPIPDWWSENLKRLVVSRPGVRSKTWFLSGERIQDAELCDPNLFVALLELPALSQLEYLKVFELLDYHDVPDGAKPKEISDRLPAFDLAKLNSLTSLKQLEINFKFDHLYDTLKLSLPNLEVLFFSFQNSQCRLKLNYPQLKVLCYDEDSDKHLLDVTHPHSITRLSSTNFNGNKLTRFTNLRHLKGRDFQMIANDTLVAMPKLESLTYNKSLHEFFEDYFTSNPTLDGSSASKRIDELKEFLKRFLGNLNELKMFDLKFSFSGLRFTASDNVDAIDFGLQTDLDGQELVSVEHLYANNLERISPDGMPFVDAVDYTRLQACAANETLEAVLQHFRGASVASVSGLVECPEHLAWFLSKLKYLRVLKLSESKLSQQFYNYLLPIFSSITEMQLQESSPGFQLIFDFVTKLKHLRVLTVLADLPVKSTRSLIAASFGQPDGPVHQLRFKAKGTACEIRVRTAGEFDATIDGDLVLKGANLQAILAHFERM